MNIFGKGCFPGENYIFNVMIEMTEFASAIAIRGVFYYSANETSLHISVLFNL